MAGRTLHLAVFDFDHTIANLGRWVDWSAARDEVVAVYRGVGVDVEALLRTGRGSFSVFRAADEALCAQGRSSEEVRVIRQRAFDALERFELEGAGQVEFMPGALEALEWLTARTVRLAVASANGPAALQAALARLGLEGCLVAVVGRSADLSLKPEPDQLLKCLELAGCAPELAVAIGDSPEDMMAARACGMRTVGVLGGVGSANSLRRAGAQQVIENLASLGDILGEPPGLLLGD